MWQIEKQYPLEKTVLSNSHKINNWGATALKPIHVFEHCDTFCYHYCFKMTTAVRFPAENLIFLFAATSRPNLGLTHSSIQSVPALFIGGKWEGLEADRSPSLPYRSLWYGT